MKTSDVLVTFNGHRSAVTALAFDKSGSRLVSGSRDTDLIVWDVEGEVGLYRYEKPLSVFLKVVCLLEMETRKI